MTFVMNAGPSFNLTRPGSSYPDLSGFSQRFMLSQNDPRMTPGKAEPHLPGETMKGTTKMRKSNRSIKKKACKEYMPKGQPEPIYGGFAKSKPSKVTGRVVRKKSKKLKKQRVK
jgi:hypothetical protein